MSKSHPRWRMAKRVLTVLFFIAVIVLLVIYAQKVDWQDVWKVIRGYDRLALFSAIALVIGMRYRLYSRLGLNGSTITRIFSLSITTNWLGYILLGGVIFTADLVKLPPHWYISQTTLRIIGGVMLILTLCYLFGCAFAKRRHLTIKGQRLVLPSWRFALLQMGLSAANWMAMGAIIWLLLGSEINYFLVLGVLLVSSIAGVIIHIPAGIGVLEAVFIAMLSGEDISKGAIIAALLAWRALYYFLPLLLATVAYLLLESRAKKLRQKNQRKLARE